MTDANAHSSDVLTRPSHFSAVLPAAIPALVISALATLWCRWMTGASLGLFLGTLLLIALCTPQLVLSVPIRFTWVPTTSIVLGAGAIWLASAPAADVSVLEWIRCALVLAGLVTALAGIALLLRSFNLPAPLASALTVLPALLWLTWPVWLSPWLTEPLASWLVPAHPGFAINSVLKHLGTWDHAPIAYSTLTVLDQDVPYHLPTTIVPSVVLHVLIGASAGWVAFARDKRARNAAARER